MLDMRHELLLCMEGNHSSYGHALKHQDCHWKLGLLKPSGNKFGKQMSVIKHLSECFINQSSLLSCCHPLHLFIHVRHGLFLALLSNMGAYKHSSMKPTICFGTSSGPQCAWPVTVPQSPKICQLDGNEALAAASQEGHDFEGQRAGGQKQGKKEQCYGD